MKLDFVAYVARRLLLIPVVVAVLAVASFSLTSLIPGDPAVAIAGPNASRETVAAIRGQLHLDEPVTSRFLDYVEGVLHGDLGTSFFTGRSVTREMAERAPATIELVLCSLIVAVLFGVAVGVASAYWRDGWLHSGLELLTSLLQSIPHFVLGVLGILVFFYMLGVAPPPVGRHSIGGDTCTQTTGFLLVDCTIHLRFASLFSALSYLALPSLTLGLHYAPYFTRVTAVKVATGLDSDHTEFARALGVSEGRVLGRALQAGKAPIITYGALTFVSLLGGSAIVEAVFSWNGLGQWAIDGILRLDLPVVQGYVMVIGTLCLLAFLMTDLLVTAIDRRIVL